MQKITYTNSRGESLSFAHDSPFILSRIEGLGNVEAEVQTQKSPYQDGATLVDTLLEPRYIPVTFLLKGKSHEEITGFRGRVSKVFNPKLGLGKLEYETAGRRWEIYATCESSPLFLSGEARGTTHQLGTIDLIAPNPYWRSPEQITEPLAAFIPLRTYPTVYPVIYGRRGSEAILYNDGDVPCPVQIELTGPALSPVVTNRTTGEFIRITRELYEGDKLIINTAPGQEQMVAIERQGGTLENAWHYIDIWESTLFSLDVGENVLDYDALTGQGLVTISFNKLFIGV